MHDNTMLPVGKASNVRIEDGALKARAEFTPAGLVKYNDIVFEMLKTGFLSATSVGFIPLKYNFVDDPQRRFGIDFLEQELLEFSIVTVPANAEALIEGRSAASAELAPEAGRCRRTASNWPSAAWRCAPPNTAIRKSAREGGHRTGIPRP
jgi:HK97 family phage prohead protease